jgi:hypothetical protein
LPEQVRRQSTVEFRQKSQQAAGEPDDNQKRGHGETGVTMDQYPEMACRLSIIPLVFTSRSAGGKRSRLVTGIFS